MTQNSLANDERAIRDLVATWMEASRAGDTAKVLSLMADDVIFQVPDREPFGKEAFASMSQSVFSKPASCRRLEDRSPESLGCLTHRRNRGDA